MIDKLKTQGEVDVVINYTDSQNNESFSFTNTILNKGRAALAKSLANEIGDSYSFFISTMLFGNGGTTGAEIPLVVNADRTGFFGSTILSKSVISSVDPSINSQVVFTTTIKAGEAVGEQISELALRMNNGDFYSMATFAGVNKTSNMEITFNWRLSFV